MKKMDKKGIFKNLKITGIISGVILLVLAFNVAAVGLPLIVTAGGLINATGLPFATFFLSTGIVMIGLMGALILAVVKVLGLGSNR